MTEPVQQQQQPLFNEVTELPTNRDPSCASAEIADLFVGPHSTLKKKLPSATHAPDEPFPPGATQRVLAPSLVLPPAPTLDPFDDLLAPCRHPMMAMG